MRTRRAEPASYVGTLMGGLAASSVILGANQLAERLRVTDLDLPLVLGLSFFDPDHRGTRLAGAAWYFLAGGVVVPTLYWLGFRSLGKVGPWSGLALGLAHYLASGLVLAASDPSRPKRPSGRGRPMGPLLSGYGALERAANLLGHLGYGTALGWGSARRRPGA